MPLRTGATKLIKNGVRNSCSEQNFSVRDGNWSVPTDRAVKGFNQELHAGVHVKVPSQKQSYILDQISEMLLRKQHRRNQVVRIALEFLAAKPKHNFVALIKNETVFRTIDSKLVDQRPHLGRKSKIGGGPLFLKNHNSELIHNLSFAYPFEKRTYEAVCDHLRIIASQELRNSADPVADDVV